MPGCRVVLRPLLLTGALVGGLPGQEAAATFAGRWSSTFGPVEWKQEGTQVLGQYGYDRKSLDGKVSDGVLEARYQGGTAEFRLWEDGRTFTGSFVGDAGRKGSWCGYRIAPAVAVPTPGAITSGQTKSSLHYHLRVPKSFDKDRRYPAIGFFHGSNMTSKDYVSTIAAVWPEIARTYILVGFDGENLSRFSKPGRRVFNFSYVNFGGPDVGPEAARRQSPALVAEALDQLNAELPIRSWFLGGHSQGGFLTYAMAMFYPDKMAGVFPMSCNLLVQCEPARFTDPAIRARQRRLPIAVVHGVNDRVVKFDGAVWCHRSMIDGGFPAVKMFSDDTAAHMFARLPVDAAVRWLETMTSEDPIALLAFADRQIEAEEYRDATAALARIRALGVPGDLRGNVDALAAKIDGEAREEAETLLTAIQANEDNGWVDDFLEFREQFAFAGVAARTMDAYAALRARHEKPAEKLFYAARRLEDDEDRQDKYREIVRRYYASRFYVLVRDRVED